MSWGTKNSDKCDFVELEAKYDKFLHVLKWLLSNIFLVIIFLGFLDDTWLREYIVLGCAGLFTL